MSKLQQLLLFQPSFIEGLLKSVVTIYKYKCGGYITKLYFKGYLVPQNKLKHHWNKTQTKQSAQIN